ncbi:MAG TPA: RsmG family class I SAM-dependent methyltransferase, partial [Fimbriimonas sp.]|nr:RsmG family class I SAM-dependent methyltransferase [Fimbriimonas sp.]
MCDDERKGTLLDIGTGPGFPAWPLACAFPDLQVTAMDSNSKMLEFLRRHPLPNLEIVEGRAEEMRRSRHYDVVTGRAVAPLSAQLEISADYAKLERKIIPMRTPNDDLQAPDYGILGLELGNVETVTLPGTDIQRTFPIYWKRKHTPNRFPRRWSEIKKKPL